MLISQDEELQKEADAVLWGVTQKKTEARRQISLLSALLELRQVRVKRLTAAGQTVSQTQIDSFNTVIGWFTLWGKEAVGYVVSCDCADKHFF